jgi:bifunctional non-homologous end joining protein LigD
VGDRKAAVVEVAGRRLRLSNLGKVLYPGVGMTKGEVVDYYSRIAPVLLPHLADRPLTLKRYPDGVDGKSFFEKNAPSHTPDWVRTARLPTPGSSRGREEIDYVVCGDLPTLVWLANLAAIELHVPQWRVRGSRPRGADHLVLDLDPGPPATLAECCEVACMLREEIAADGFTGHAKTSGRKGLQVYAPVNETDARYTSAYAKDLAVRLEQRHPDLVVSKMTKKLREGKVFIDWSQNNAAKTTVAPYSLRANDRPTVSTPLLWDEVESGPPPLYTAPEVLERVESLGDLFAPLLGPGPRVPR